jgi:hypothetical protein
MYSIAYRKKSRPFPACLHSLVFGLALLLGAETAGAHSLTQVASGLDSRFIELERQVPGFGGYFFDGDGNLNVYLTDLSQEGAARAAVTEVARNRGERSEQPWSRPAEIVVRRGNFDFAQLHRWRARLNTALPQIGVRLIDIDEAKNRIFVGVADEAAKSDVLTLVDQLGLPQNAVTVDFVGEVSRATSVNDFVRPLVGGLAIWQTGNPCTLGVNVYYTNLAVGIPVGTPGFFTASHCSSTQGTTDGTVFTQGGTGIGYEAWDPPFFTNAQNTACRAGYRCRWSDVAFAANYNGVSRHQGALVQTLYRSLGTQNSGSLDINSSSPEFAIIGGTYPVQGMYLDKVGRTTGWTSGPVDRTCTDVYLGDGTGTLCQDVVVAKVGGGDSGSPVFRWTGSTTAAFAGILWGWDSQTGGFYFSNTDRIQADMGTGITYGPN